MCGIAGVLAGPRAAPVPLDELRRMIAVLGHRGPDGHGLYRDPRIGLAHARLSIVDLAGGFQPIHNEDRSIWITFNGEIFNHVELRRDLIARGHHFYTDTDSEVIVHAYEEYGPGAWARFNGQFAVALWDGRRRRLWLARDRLGILPLHYARAGGHVAFASEAKALFAGGRVAPCIDPERLAEVFTRWSPVRHGSVFAGIDSVRAGTALCIEEDLRTTELCYWQPDLATDPSLRDLPQDEAAGLLGERLATSVRLRLRADVPVGVYISGGLDSSVIAGLVHRAGTQDVHSFGIRFEDPAFDETPQQRLVADFLGTTHHEVFCRAADIQRVLPDVIWHCETPLLRTAPAPLFLLSGLVREHGLRVVLSGEGADELLGGYDIFKEDRIRRFWARQPDSACRPHLLGRIHAFAAAGGAKTSPLWQQFFRQGLGAVDDPCYSHRIRWRNTAWTLRLLSPEVRAAAAPEGLDADAVHGLPPGWAGWSPLARAQFLEIETFMTPYLLSCQGDRVAMAHGVEVRYPFLDPEVVALCARLPDRVKLLGLRDKQALRRLAGRLLPPEIGQRPKRPYRAPMTAALFGAEAPDYVRALLAPAALARSGLIDVAAAGRLAARAHAQNGRMAGEREEMALVGLLTLQLLDHAFRVEGPQRYEERYRHLEASPPHVLEDRLSSDPERPHPERPHPERPREDRRVPA